MAKDTTTTQPGLVESTVIVEETPSIIETPVTEEITTIPASVLSAGVSINRNY